MYGRIREIFENKEDEEEVFENLKEWERKKMCESRNKSENFESCDNNREIDGPGESYENNAGVT